MSHPHRPYFELGTAALVEKILAGDEHAIIVEAPHRKHRDIREALRSEAATEVLVKYLVRTRDASVAQHLTTVVNHAPKAETKAEAENRKRSTRYAANTLPPEIQAEANRVWKAAFDACPTYGEKKAAGRAAKRAFVAEYLANAEAEAAKANAAVAQVPVPMVAAPVPARWDGPSVLPSGLLVATR